MNTGFLLTVGGHSGNAGDALTYHSGRQFYTKDKTLARAGPAARRKRITGARGGTAAATIVT